MGEGSISCHAQTTARWAQGLCGIDDVYDYELADRAAGNPMGAADGFDGFDQVRSRL
mgnify:CR=1 FL=1